MLVGSRDGTFVFSYPDPASILITDTEDALQPPDENQGHLCLSTLLAMGASLIATQRTIIHLTNTDHNTYEEVPYVRECC